MTNNPTTCPVVELKDITVNYGFYRAIDSVSFNLLPGMALGLIGANGAGKTTSIRAILGMLKIKKGQVTLFGESRCTSKTFHRIGFAPEEATPPEYLNAREYLTFLSKLKKQDISEMKRQVEDFLTWFDLDPNKPVRKYSKGMRRRLVLAQAFVGRPELIILDEPLNGLDPLMIQKLRTKLVEYRQKGASIIYSSHILSELETTCSDVVMMHKGKVVLRESIPNLIQKYGSVEKAFSSNVGGN